ncbi:MAG TPA: NAD(P)H-binding protein [Burkholderiaceae bacterium]|jgi:uncharacterized protein YbjT (DUF2867 family)
MKILLFGASGMVGQGVLRECLAAPDVNQVNAVGRAPLAQTHPKLQHVVAPDLADLHDAEAGLKGFDACFFCLGVSSAGMSEVEYTRLTHDLTLAAAATLARLNPGMSFVYVSGAGTDGTERGRTMWARVKGRTENDLQRLGFAKVCLFRPGIIQPLHGIRSKTGSYRVFYALTGPLLSLARRAFPNEVLSTEAMGLAMLNAVRRRAGGIFESAGIARLAQP